MELGLACSTCGQLNTLRTQSCNRCGSTLAPSIPREAGPPSFSNPPTGPGGNEPTSAYTAVGPEAAAAGPAEEVKPARTMFFGALQQEDVAPRLVLIKGEGTDGVTYHLKGSTQVLGRTEGDIQFDQDIFLSPQHARFTVQAGRLFVQDAGSANGVFLRIQDSATLEDGDCFLAGEQLLRLDLTEVPTQTPTSTGTYFYGSPRVTSKFRVTQLLAGGSEGIMACAEDSLLSIGREGNILDFPDDNFISGRHAQLRSNGASGVTLEDLGSRNGTFHRVRGAHELHNGDYVFIGQQLFRVEIS